MRMKKVSNFEFQHTLMANGHQAVLLLLDTLDRRVLIALVDVPAWKSESQSEKRIGENFMST